MGGTVGRTVLMTTNHAPIRVTESIQKSIDKNEFGCSILIDLKTAIDTVIKSFYCFIKATCGVLQGSIHGPLMSLLSFYLFTDDINITLLYCSSN